MKHDWDPNTWRCTQCQEPFREKERNLPCWPDHTLNAVSVAPPSEREAPDADADA